MEKQMAKGMYVSTCMLFIEKHYTPEQQAKIRAQLSPDLVEALPTIKANEWYPLHFATDQVRGIFQAHEDLDEAEAAIKRCGKFIGEQASTTFLKFLMKILTMKLMARKWPEFWLKYHNFGAMRAELPSSNHLVLFITPGYDYMYKMGAGWVEVVCSSMGLKDVVIKDNMPRGQTTIDEIRLDVTWR